MAQSTAMGLMFMCIKLAKILCHATTFIPASQMKDNKTNCKRIKVEIKVIQI